MSQALHDVATPSTPNRWSCHYSIHELCLPTRRTRFRHHRIPARSEDRLRNNLEPPQFTAGESRRTPEFVDSGLEKCERRVDCVGSLAEPELEGVLDRTLPRHVMEPLSQIVEDVECVPSGHRDPRFPTDRVVLDGATCYIGGRLPDNDTSTLDFKPLARSSQASVDASGSGPSRSRTESQDSH